MKFLSSILLTLSLATTATTANADVIAPTLGEILSNPAIPLETDTGAQAIQFSDFLSGTDNSVFEILLESAGLADSNSMGLYLYNTVAKTASTGRFELFSGDKGENSYTNLVFDFDENRITRERGTEVANFKIVDDTTVFGGLGDILATQQDDFYADLATLNLANFEIGVYLNNGTTDFFSHNHLNLNEQRMVGIFDYSQDNGLVFAWEDTAGGDLDYNDMVVLANDVSVVPEPTSLAIFGLGLLALARVSRRKA